MFFRYILVVLWGLVLSEGAFAETGQFIEEGRQQCISNPASCGINCSSCCSNTDTNGSTAAGIAQCKNNPISCGIISEQDNNGSTTEGRAQCTANPSSCGITINQDTNGSTQTGIDQCKSNPSSCEITAATLGITPDPGDGAEVDGISKAVGLCNKCAAAVATIGDKNDDTAACDEKKIKINGVDHSVKELCGITALFETAINASTNEVSAKEQNTKDTCKACANAVAIGKEEDVIKNCPNKLKDECGITILEDGTKNRCKGNPAGCGITTVALTEEIKKTLADNNKTVPKFEIFGATSVLYIPKVSLDPDINLGDSACDVYMTAVNNSLFELKGDPIIPCPPIEVVPPTTDNATNPDSTVSGEVVPPIDNDAEVQPTTIFKLTVKVFATKDASSPVTTVTSADGISCSSEQSAAIGTVATGCVKEYEEGSKVTLTVTGQNASFEYKWEGDGCPKVTMDGDKTCTLTVAKSK